MNFRIQITKRTVLLIMILLGTLSISSCSAGSSPAATIEGYLLALAEVDEISAVNLSCADWEEQALAESASFKTVEVTLEDIECQIDYESSDLSFVFCNGRFVFSYDVIRQVKKTPAGKDNELWVADVLNNLAHKGKKVIAQPIEGEWLTTGDPLRYMKTQVKYALKRKDIGEDFKIFLQSLKL